MVTGWDDEADREVLLSLVLVDGPAIIVRADWPEPQRTSMHCALAGGAANHLASGHAFLLAACAECSVVLDGMPQFDRMAKRVHDHSELHRTHRIHECA